MEIEDLIPQRDLSKEIEDLKAKSPLLNYIECTVIICEKYDVEVEGVKALLSKPIKDKIEYEANKLLLLKTRSNTLDL